MMTCIMPLMRGMSVPGICLSHSLAYFTSPWRRGSTTIRSLFLKRAARLMRAAMTGWFSLVLEPITRMQSASSSSAMELVIAPEPKLAARPATVELCQRRAQ